MGEPRSSAPSRLTRWQRITDLGFGWRLAASGAVVAIVVLIVGDNLGHWSQRQPVVMTVVTDLVQIALVAAFLEAVTRNREQKRVDEVGRIMFRALAQAALDCSRRLDAYLGGWALEERGVPFWSAATTSSVRDHLAGAGLPVATSLSDRNREERLRRLLTRHGYAKALYREMSEHKRRFHDEIGRWAPLLLATDAQIEDLAHMRRLADSFGELHQALYHGAATALPENEWVAAPAWLDEVQEATAQYLTSAERARAFYHGLAEEQRRLREFELDDALAVTTQRPAYLEQSRRPPSA